MPLGGWGLCYLTSGAHPLPALSLIPYEIQLISLGASPLSTLKHRLPSQHRRILIQGYRN